MASSPKRLKPRLLPIVIGAAAVLLTVKLDVLWHGRGTLIATEAQAQTATTPPAAGGDLTPAQFQHMDAGNAADEVPQRVANPPAVLPAAMAPLGGQPAVVDTGTAGVAQTAFVGASGSGGTTGCTPAEAQLLNDVAARRAQLDKRSEDLDRRALLLKAVEERIDGKIKKLQDTQANINALLGQVDQQQQDRLNSLVHIYENMKPQYAAGILQQMDMPVQLQILSRMRDLKTAPILAAMDPDKARAVTIALAQKQQVPADASDVAAAPPQSAPGATN
jgi:flagellar motility protein MotE (MotC chaperone)